MYYPSGLKPGDTIRVVAPAAYNCSDEWERCRELLCEWGYKVKAGSFVDSQWGYLAGRDEERAKDLEAAFMDDECAAVLCLRGGYGTTRILDLIDYDLIRRNAKLFIGFIGEKKQ